MTRWGRSVSGVARVVVAIMMIAPAVPARADLLNTVTDPVGVTVEETTDGDDETADGTTDAVDESTGSTGTVIDEPIDDTTDLVDGLSDSATTVVDETEDSVTEVVDDDDGSDPGETTNPSPGTTTTVAPSTDTSNTAAHDAPVTEDEAPVSALESDNASGGTISTTRSELPEPIARLTVLSAAHGLGTSSVSDLVDVALVTDVSLYGRLLGWLTSGQSGVFGLLAGPVLALEILLRALTSAGSGLVAPLSLLSAYLFRLMWQLHVRRTPAV